MELEVIQRQASDSQTAGQHSRYIRLHHTLIDEFERPHPAHRVALRASLAKLWIGINRQGLLQKAFCRVSMPSITATGSPSASTQTPQGPPCSLMPKSSSLPSICKTG